MIDRSKVNSLENMAGNMLNAMKYDKIVLLFFTPRLLKEYTVQFSGKREIIVCQDEFSGNNLKSVSRA